MKKKQKLLLTGLAILAPIISAPALVSCFEPTRIWPKTPNPVPTPKPQVDNWPKDAPRYKYEEPAYTKTLITETPEAPKMNTETGHWSGVDNFYHYVLNIHKLNLTKEQKIQRYLEASGKLTDFLIQLRSIDPSGFNIWEYFLAANGVDLDEYNKKEEEARNRHEEYIWDPKYPAFTPKLFDLWFRDIRFMSETRLKEGTLKLNKEQLRTIRRMNELYSAFLALPMVAYLNSYKEVLYNVEDLRAYCYFMISIYRTEWDENKTFTEQVKSYAKEASEIVDNMFTDFEYRCLGMEIKDNLKPFLFGFNPAIDEFYYSPVYHFNNTVKSINNFALPIVVLTDYFEEDVILYRHWNNKTAPDWRMLCGRHDDLNDVDIEPLIKDDKKTAILQLRKWLTTEIPMDAGIKFSKIIENEEEILGETNNTDAETPSN
ncbi:hypothetical protein [[Mycoplasma] anseris]|uniref:Lipoprotein n=1 Tax=[Mycoplasma] anseris TaxID=92400 RepID=A0A2Z4ND99_9BACT|nr:hypothetical protein [[Mycoplasma] anseris]AWX69561.1 hypothetical protein DP065_02235 [[Mycoplasma] anseris]